MVDFSIVTIVKGRRKQLANLLESVEASVVRPYDIQIVCMDNGDDIRIPPGLNVQIHSMQEMEKLPLAAARNRGINASMTAQVIFIDVDCIVSPTLFLNMLNSLHAENIITAYPLYLPVLPESGDFDELQTRGLRHPGRTQIPHGTSVDHLLFWSLIFAVKKETFKKIGGFDESFEGYGAEDTDFAMAFHQKGIELMFIPDYVLHQYHQKYDPPLNYFESILKNAMRYREKWNVLPMKRWLRAFEDLNLIKIEPSDRIIVCGKPSDRQIKESLSRLPY